MCIILPERHIAMSFYPRYTREQIQGRIRNAYPATNIVDITPSDVTVYDPVLRGFTVGEAGNVTVLTYDDFITGNNTPKTIPCAVGADKPINVVKIFASGTTATNIVAYRG